jgi:hypothetical protein
MKRRKFIADAVLTGSALSIGLPVLNGATSNNNIYQTGKRTNPNYNNHPLRLISIEPLNATHAKELVADIKEMASKGILNEVAFSFTLVPEGNPPVDKMADFGPRYLQIRKLLGDVPFKVGILAQATIGHNYTLIHPHPFQPQISLDGTVNAGTVCPMDEGFHAYLKKIFRQIAELKPDFFIVDDDFRLVTPGRNACICPLHVKAFNSKYNRQLTQEQLRQHLRGTTAEDQKIAEQFDAINAESLYGAAKTIREAVDEINPAIPGTYCACTADIRYAAGIEKELTGKNQPISIRLNNARYLQPGPGNYVVRMQSTAIQMATIGKTDCVLAETDTYPQNRYSTSARVLHSNFTGYLLEGCKGAKHWITRFSEWEPNSGKAYREILATYRGFYEELSRNVEGIRYSGPGSVIPEKPFMNWNRPEGKTSVVNSFESLPSWNTLLPAGFGQPLHFRKASEGPGMLVGDECSQFSDEEIHSLLSKGLLLDGTAAEALQQRGFGTLLGVKVEPWDGEPISGEIISAQSPNQSLSGKQISDGSHPYKLMPISATTKVAANYIHRPFTSDSHFKTGEPSAILFQNSLGGRIAIVGTTPEGTGYANETRKAFLLALMNWVEPFPVYYTGDEEVYLKAGETTDHSLLVAAINFCSDPIEEFHLTTGKTFKNIYSLTPEGTWKAIRFKQSNHEVILPERLEFMMPMVWKMA